MKRREVMAAIGGAAVGWTFAAHAQQVAKVRTIGFLGQLTPSAMGKWTAAFVRRLSELGWVEGRTVAIEYRWAEGRSERFAEVAAELVRLKVDVVVTGGTAAVLAAKQATSLIPIVFATAGDPVGAGLVAKSRSPGRQRDRPVESVSRSSKQTARAFARDFPRCPAARNHGQCRQSDRLAGDG